ncbi:hypothetical protein ACJX0J_015001, partial [Zea mays]
EKKIVVLFPSHVWLDGVILASPWKLWIALRLWYRFDGNLLMAGVQDLGKSKPLNKFSFCTMTPLADTVIVVVVTSDDDCTYTGTNLTVQDGGGGGGGGGQTKTEKSV